MILFISRVLLQPPVVIDEICVCLLLVQSIESMDGNATGLLGLSIGLSFGARVELATAAAVVANVICFQLLLNKPLMRSSGSCCEIYAEVCVQLQKN
jgi:hypothetical protein